MGGESDAGSAGGRGRTLREEKLPAPGRRRCLGSAVPLNCIQSASDSLVLVCGRGPVGRLVWPRAALHRTAGDVRATVAKPINVYY